KGTRVTILGTRVWPFGAPEIPPELTRLPSPPERGSLAPGDLIVAHDHPLLPFSRVSPNDLDAAAPCRTEIARFSPFGPSWQRSRFGPADASYIRIAGFRGVERPGPIVTIWRVERCAGGVVAGSPADDGTGSHAAAAGARGVPSGGGGDHAAP